MVLIPKPVDETMLAVRKAAEHGYSEERRAYIGASSVGNPCSRAIWYEWKHTQREPFNYSTLWLFEDGHRTEDLIAQRLRNVKGIELWTHKPDGKQYGFSAFGGVFKGHADGIIRGLIQAPKTPHIWENKTTGDKKFAEFKNLKLKYGEKKALKHWNEVYYAQAQILMYYFNLDRHYTTVATAGGRELDACRTELDREFAVMLIDKVAKIISCEKEPVRLSEKADFFKCRFCPFAKVCHGSKDS